MSVRIVTTSPRQRRHARVRAKIFGTADRPRLSVFRSLKHVTVQLIDDSVGQTIVAASDQNQKTEDSHRRGGVPQRRERQKTEKTKGGKTARARQVGEKIAELAMGKKITSVVFDRGGYRYHGRVKAVADGARAGGLKF